MDLLFPSEQIDVEPPVQRPLDVYVVVANWKGEWWKVSKETYTSQDQAIAAAKLLDAGGIHRKVFRLTDKKPTP